MERGLGYLLIEVGGLGYEVRVALNADIGTQDGEEIFLHTYFVVRETSQELYGFPTIGEREMFLLLIDLPGIGPKSALHIMSQADIALLRESAISGDAAYLSKLSGIGKKSAEKIVAGLKDKVGESLLDPQSGKDNDLIDALLSLGYSQNEARNAIQNLPPEAEGTSERLKAALRTLGSK